MFNSRLLFQPGRQLVSRHAPLSPPSITRQRSQAFHATAQRKDGFIEAIVQYPREMLQLLHSTGIPWCATLPLSAFMLRAVLVTTMGSRSRSIQARYLALNPLRQAMTLQTKKDVMASGKFQSPAHLKATVGRASGIEISDLHKRWKCGLRPQLGWTLLQIPIFLTMAETIRKMCNTRQGLLGMAASSIGLGKSEEKVDWTEGTDAAAAIETNEYLEPSLANEGMLWFPDLLVPDPTGALPYITSVLMFYNIWKTKNTPDQMTGFSKGLRRVLLFVALLIGPFTQAAPAALLLYWASSTTSVMLWNVWLDRRYPSPTGFSACKRPLMLMPPPLKARRV
ncbi:hypothetical protein K469DRAFT_709081 [Zopfia rhizophila CBS 207.26]|uniref:Mitochondrial export translocase Oxa2 n=1 Tax=Zopfia rhizophila CBS 207.26 TaxID=1314779 RepID=A0A6A6E1I2_9PEZI|nr:hypothetical protein K469DRAFT_709081 [Zopfia rhizophila CBS 207.26]